jgi:hypothetical protein
MGEAKSGLFLILGYIRILNVKNETTWVWENIPHYGSDSRSNKKKR